MQDEEGKTRCRRLNGSVHTYAGCGYWHMFSLLINMILLRDSDKQVRHDLKHEAFWRKKARD